MCAGHGYTRAAMNRLSRFAVSLLLVSACSASTDSPTLDKGALAGAGGKADTDVVNKVCIDIGAGPGCDLCDIAGWYGDGECDTFCFNHDPDCGDVCGGWFGVTCAADEFCDYTLEATCGWADATGTCQTKPEYCTFEHTPVCGCDGNTYSNTCHANAAGTAVVHAGTCETVLEECGDVTCAEGEICCPGCPGAAPLGCFDGNFGCPPIACPDPGEKACGGLLGLGCDAGEFCEYALDAFCGAADQTGVCRPIPEVCTAHVDPVCGCDDSTYSNACVANAAGISVASPGPCASDPDAGAGR